MDQFEAPQINPEPKPAYGGGHPTKLNVMRAYQFLFDSPNGTMNIVWVTLCMLIPVVGPLVMLGYQFMVIEQLHRSNNGPYPDFDSSKFGDYLKRGVWPFVAMLIANIPITFIAFFASFVLPLGMGVVAGIANEVGGDGLAAVCSLIGFLFIFAFILLATVAVALVATPMALGAGLSQDLGLAFKMDFIKDFLGKVWKDLLIAQLLNMVFAWLVMLLGMLLCCIGMYPATAIVAMAAGHINYQVYELYLQRGGTEIPLKLEEA